MMRFTRNVARPSLSRVAVRNTRSFVVASQTHRAQEAPVSVPSFRFFLRDESGLPTGAWSWLDT
jgi:hypothetical protein